MASSLTVPRVAWPPRTKAARNNIGGRSPCSVTIGLSCGCGRSIPPWTARPCRIRKRGRSIHNYIVPA